MDCCAAMNCVEKSNSPPLFPCFGPCGQYFHAKCIGSTSAFIDKIISSKIAFWYCSPCRKISLSQMAFKMSALKADILKISKGFEELMSLFQVAISNSAAFSPSSYSVDASTSTASLETTSPHLELPPIIPSSPNSMLPSISLQNSKPSCSNLVSNKRKRPATKNDDTSNKRKNLRSNSNNNDKNDPNCVVPTTTDSDLILPTSLPPPISSVIPKTVEVVPKPKSIFISRLKPETTSSEIVQHLITNNVITSTDFIKVTKINKDNSFVSSFKLITSPSLFDKLCSTSSWPHGTLVKEFSYRSNKKPTVSSNLTSSKN